MRSSFQASTPRSCRGVRGLRMHLLVGTWTKNHHPAAITCPTLYLCVRVQAWNALL